MIAPYQGLKELFVEVIKEKDIDNIDVKLGNMSMGVKIAKNLEDNYDIIISRGATVKLLREYCSIPVVEVRISGYDILRALVLVNGYVGKVGIMSYFNIINEADEIGKLLDMDFAYYPINDEKEVETQIQDVVDNGFEVIIGDSITTLISEEYGIRSIMVLSGKKAVVDSIQEANQIAYYTSKEKKKSQNLKAAIEQLEQGVMIFDDQGICLFKNTIAEQILGKEEDQSISQVIQSNLPSTIQLKQDKEIIDDDFKISNNKYSIKKFPTFLNDKFNGGVVLITENKRNRSLDSNLKSCISQTKTNISELIGNSHKIKKLLQVAEKLSKSNEPIIIHGEIGTGKSSIAEAIHNESKRKDDPFLYFNCGAYSYEQLERSLFGIANKENGEGILELVESGTVCLKEVHLLPLNIQRRLVNVLQNQKVQRLYSNKEYDIDIRIIVTTKIKLNEEVSKNLFDKDLYDLLNSYQLYVPPLRERIEDIDDLNKFFISSSNKKTGKQIVGFDDELNEFFKSCLWPGNIQQLKNTIELLCNINQDPIIKKSKVENIIENTKKQDRLRYSNQITIANKTLKEIECEIIEKFLIEEQFNQSKVAKKLGINRTTLWRKLNEVNK